MNGSHTLPAEPLEHPAMDYAFLRREGLRLLERLAGDQWTDFNAHDPGITILEQVCYALTDLAYRINYDIKDLLASGQAGQSPCVDAGAATSLSAWLKGSTTTRTDGGPDTGADDIGFHYSP